MLCNAYVLALSRMPQAFVVQMNGNGFDCLNRAPVQRSEHRSFMVASIAWPQAQAGGGHGRGASDGPGQQVAEQVGERAKSFRNRLISSISDRVCCRHNSHWLGCCGRCNSASRQCVMSCRMMRWC
jgi:hypothetical protein